MNLHTRHPGDGRLAVAVAPALRSQLMKTRQTSIELAAPLSAEDQCVQAMDDASPTKWHLAHTTWFFETFVLSPHMPDYRIFDDSFHYCFNSYYEAEGPRHPRPARGLLTRPSIDAVYAYRAHVDEHLRKLCDRDDVDTQVAGLIELGIHHEQQHQELLLTDILALFAVNPLRPAYREDVPEAGHGAGRGVAESIEWISFDGGIVQVGHGGEGFAFDNETPRHDQLVRPFRLADRLVTNGEWLEFMADGGYEDAALWLADGWGTVNSQGWRAPLYFEERDGEWLQMGLHGLRKPDPAAPVAHVSFYEADAFARWAGKRLPSEFEWELAARSEPVEGNMLDSGALRTMPAPKGRGLKQMFGDVWQWTASAYLPYPGFRPAVGAVGEYNGKFMVSQHVLRGASFATSRSHARATYRNFFYPQQRWQFVGLRLADDQE